MYTLCACIDDIYVVPISVFNVISKRALNTSVMKFRTNVTQRRQCRCARPLFGHSHYRTLYSFGILHLYRIA